MDTTQMQKIKEIARKIEQATLEFDGELSKILNQPNGHGSDSMKLAQRGSNSAYVILREVEEIYEDFGFFQDEQ